MWHHCPGMQLLAFEISTLPISLAAFSGQILSENDLLFIRVAAAENVQNVIVERNSDGTDFKATGSINLLITALKVITSLWMNSRWITRIFTA